MEPFLWGNAWIEAPFGKGERGPNASRVFKAGCRTVEAVIVTSRPTQQGEAVGIECTLERGRSNDWGAIVVNGRLDRSSPVEGQTAAQITGFQHRPGTGVDAGVVGCRTQAVVAVKSQ